MRRLLQLDPAPGRARCPDPANRAVYLDKAGGALAGQSAGSGPLFGANYVLPTASDCRAAGCVKGDRKKMIDEDMAHFARMGGTAAPDLLGDWEASTARESDRQRSPRPPGLPDRQGAGTGIYMLFSPIQLYSSNWPDALAQDSATPGFGGPRQGPHGHRSGGHCGAGELPAPDPESRESLYRGGAQGRAGDPLHRAGERAPASPRGPPRLDPLYQRPDRRGAQYRVHQADFLQRESGFPDRRGDSALQGAGGELGRYPTALNSGTCSRATTCAPPTPSPTCCGPSWPGCPGSSTSSTPSIS